MKRLIKKIKHWFYKKNITRRIIIVITAVMIFSNLMFVGSVFVIMRGQLFNKTKIENEKEMLMIEAELEMFFKSIRNDAVSVLVSDACQTLLSDSEEFLTENTMVQYQKYKLMQGMIMSTIAQRSEYNNIIFYDIKGNCYADDRLIEQEEIRQQKQERVREFIAAGENEAVLPIHKSAWREKKNAQFEDCISYLRKVYNKDKGQLIGVIELEISNKAICELYQPVMRNGSAIYLIHEDQIISAANPDMLYRDLSGESWYQNLNKKMNQKEVQILEGRKYLYFQKEYQKLNWKILDVVPSSIYMKDVVYYALIDVMIGIVLLVIGLVVSRMLIVSITKPLSIITETIVKIGKGNYKQRVHVKDGGEIGMLANEFNRMVDRTELLMEQIVEKEREKREADLSLIQMQMTPHFFYNILESICGLIVMDDKRMAIHTINLLSGFYRGVLNKGKEIISIEQELEIAVNYLEIMKICHPGKFEYQIECPQEVKQNCINKLTLQPILENAIHHGFDKMPSGGMICIEGRLMEDTVILEISDNGKGISPAAIGELETAREGTGEQKKQAFHMEGFGLNSTDERIKIYFGERYGVTVVRQSIGTKIRIELPVKGGEYLV